MTTHSATRPHALRHTPPVLAERTATLLAETGLALILCLLTATAWLVATGNPYTPGSTLGYAMGLAGGLMMLALLAYPLRKRIALLRNAGPLKYWFRAHMALGLTGPLLILFHSTFRVGSLNAAVALSCMLLVAGSGVIGRFIYTRIHHELRGRKLAAIELRAELAGSLARMEGGKSLPASARRKLESYEAYAERIPGGIISRTLKFLCIGWRRLWTSWRIRRQLSDYPGGRRIASQIETYIHGLQRVAQFSVYERLFSLWHLLHIPLVALLILSAVFHVIAVHMY